MFLRTINHCADWLTMMLDEPERGREGAYRFRHPLLLVAAGFVLASALVALTTLIALGLDALLHTRFATDLVR